MLGNIFFSTAIAITLMFSASATYKSYSDLQEAKQIQESYEIIADIKNILSQQYNKSPNDITRDEIISMLPIGGSWDKILLSNRNSTLDNDALVNEDGHFILNEDQKIKLMALRAKLQNISNLNSSTDGNSQITFYDDNSKNNYVFKDKVINTNLNKIIEILDIKKSDITTETDLDNLIDAYVPYSNIYQDIKVSENEVLSAYEIKNRKKDYFKSQIKQRLMLSKNSKDINTYNQIKGLL